MNSKVDIIFKELEDISQSVNFISLNAHIEASKAQGEAGRRLSIDSEEMTKLSKKLNGSLEELKEIVQKG